MVKEEYQVQLLNRATCLADYSLMRIALGIKAQGSFLAFRIDLEAVGFRIELESLKVGSLEIRLSSSISEGLGNFLCAQVRL